MLTVDLVRARRQKGELKLTALSKKARPLALSLATDLIKTAEAHLGQERGVLYEAWDLITGGATDRKLASGVRKLVEDRCSFEAGGDCDPRELRRRIFETGFESRSQGGFDRDQVLDVVAAEFELTAVQLEHKMYADLKSQHRLVKFDPLDPESVVNGFDRAQAQAVLLKASRVVARVRSSDPAVYRQLFRKLKFRRLLCQIHPENGGYRIEIDGPLSLFSQVTKYGLGLSLVLPSIRACDEWSIDAELVWGKSRDRLRFRQSGGKEVSSAAPLIPDSVQTLISRFQKLKTGWSVSVAEDILNLPGVGLVVPDLRFTSEASGEVVFLEILGFWSRDAVWRRVELVERGLPDRIIFAVSERLRVSEAVLPNELPGELYVYKGTLSAKEIARRLSPSPPSDVI